MLRTSLTLIGLLCFQSAMAAEQQILELEQLLLKHDYRSIVEKIDTKNDNDDEIVAWLRSHYQEWHPPLFYTLSAKLAEKIIANVTTKARGQNRSIDAEDSKLLKEMAESYARGKTSFMFDIADCVDNRLVTPTYWLRRNNVATLPIESLLSLDKTGKGLTVVAGLSFLWAKPIVLNSIKYPATRPSTTWLCGDGNVLPDRDRQVVLENKWNAVGKQIDERSRNALPN